jgi:ABC-type phosphate transport system substrate-binding protein
MITKQRRLNNESAVSVLIGTLALILVVVAGSAGIAMVYGNYATGASKQISPDNSAEATRIPIYVAGSDNMDYLTRTLGSDYSSTNPSVRIVSNVIDPDGIYSSLISKTTDIGALSGITIQEDLIHNPDIVIKQIGSSAIVVITNKNYPGVTSSNPIQYSDLKAFFTTGAKGGVINATLATPVIRSDDSGTANTFYNNFLGVNTVTSLGIAESSDAEVISSVESIPNTIGFADFGDAQTAIANGHLIKIVPVCDAMQCYPTVPNYSGMKGIAQYQYRSTARHADGTPVWTGNQTDVTGYNLTLIYPLYYITKDNPNSAESGFLEFAASPSSQGSFMKASVFSIAGL